MAATDLEQLTNELFFGLFEYLHAVDLLRAFRDLNSRFQSLLFDHFHAYRVDLRSIAKKDFTDFYPTSLSSIADRTIYLRLSDDDDTPFQCAHFLSPGITLGRFTNLQALTLNCVGSDERVDDTFFAAFDRLIHLRCLKLVDCWLDEVKDLQALTDTIWRLPQLAYLYWDAHAGSDCALDIPTVVSRSLRYLSIPTNQFSANLLGCLIEKTPALQSFRTELDSYEEDDRSPLEAFIHRPAHLSLTKLSLSNVRSLRELTNLLTLVSHVKHLKIEVFNLRLNGHDWQEMICQHLPRLETFALLMDTTVNKPANEQDHKKLIDAYLRSYTSSFWLDRKWFVRCHSQMNHREVSIRLYTLPYKFNAISSSADDNGCRTTSTAPSDAFFGYDAVRNVCYPSSVYSREVCSGMQMKNVDVLSVSLPTDQHFFTVFPRLDDLWSLCITIHSPDPPAQLQHLLDRAPRLFSLTFDSWSTKAMPPYGYTSRSVRRLNLRNTHRTYNEEQCTQLCQSPLGRTARVLLINVEKAVNILQLICYMKSLRTLRANYKGDDKRNKRDCLKDLRKHASSTWTIKREFYGHFIARS